VSATAERRTWFGLWPRRAEERVLSRANVPAVMLQPSVAGIPMSAEAALRIVDVFACVRLLAEAAATLPLVAYRRTGLGRERAEGRLSALLDRPAPATTQANLVAQLVGCLALRGNCFLGKYRNREGEVEQLGVLPPDRVQVEIKGGAPRYTLTRDDGRQTVHDSSDVVHLRGLSLDGVVGLSPIAQAREALGLAATLEQHASALFANGSTPKGVLTVAAGPGNEDLLENLRAGFELRHGGPKNAGRVAVLSGEIKFTPVSVTPADAQFVAQRKLSTVEIARLFRIPPHMVGGEAGNSLTYSTTELEAAHFLRFSLAPWLVVVEQALTADADLCPNGSSLYVEFLTDALLRADSKTRADVYTAALNPQTGWMTREEVRRLENLPAERPVAVVPEREAA
jgi:HK97 family phage portal protein